MFAIPPVDFAGSATASVRKGMPAKPDLNGILPAYGQLGTSRRPLCRRRVDSVVVIYPLDGFASCIETLQYPLPSDSRHNASSLMPPSVRPDSGRHDALCLAKGSPPARS